MTRDQKTMLVLTEVFEERRRQFELWGDQRLPFHHPVDGDGTMMFGAPYGITAEVFKEACDSRHAMAQSSGQDTRSDALVLLEEVFEALAETDPARIREELIQVAAVAVKAVETLDRDGDGS